MAKAGYNPDAAIEFWSRFTAGSPSSVLDGWMSTHPADADRIAAMRQVLPDAEHFNEISGRLDPAFMEENDVDAIYLADDDGYVVLVSPRGFGGELVMTVGIDPDLAVTGIVITEQSETPGLGTKAQTPEYLSQYVGKTGTLQLVKGAAAEGQISAVSGATVSSRGITAGVQAALRAAGNVA